ncbi:MAG TPA: CopD family protein [Casimicrobiaceae bacterium]|nr:CopD family protein [Casimicrobiaceae bacterium]
MLLGSISFALTVDASRTRAVILVAALATAATALATTAVTGILLVASLGLGVRDIATAGFAVAGGTRVFAALVIAGLAVRIAPRGRLALACLVPAFVVLGAAVGDTHAVARIGDAGPLVVATAAHELGAGIWLGGLPCFWYAMRHADAARAQAIGRRFSRVAVCGVVLITAGATVFAVDYIGSVEGVYATAYGAMAATKGVLLAMLLALGAANYRAVHRVNGDTARVVRFVEIEMALGLAVLIAAASMTSAPPSVDDIAARPTLSEIAARMTPVVPRLASPAHATLGAAATPNDVAARNAEDRAWAEFNHHWAGILVVMMGVAGLAQHSGRARWARHWPLLFLLLAAFLLLRADPEVWPMGPVGPIESLRDPEVLQHRLFVVLIVAFALFEWRIRTGRIASTTLARVFPVVTAIGAALLLLHSHAVTDPKEQLLIEYSHLPIAVLGIVAACARWLEVAAPGDEGRAAGWVWPAAFVLVGLLLLNYREA